MMLLLEQLAATNHKQTS